MSAHALLTFLQAIEQVLPSGMDKLFAGFGAAIASLDAQLANVFAVVTILPKKFSRSLTYRYALAAMLDAFFHFFIIHRGTGVLTTSAGSYALIAGFYAGLIFLIVLKAFLLDMF